jgi:hypothetical protein
MPFVVPLALDTSKPDWRRQFRSVKTCECGARFGWVVFHDEEYQRDRWAPYNESDGQLHHVTCPRRKRFRRTLKEPKGAAVARSAEAVKDQPSERKPSAVQGNLFGLIDPVRYGVD